MIQDINKQQLYPSYQIDCFKTKELIVINTKIKLIQYWKKRLYHLIDSQLINNSQSKIISSNDLNSLINNQYRSIVRQLSLLFNYLRKQKIQQQQIFQLVFGYILKDIVTNPNEPFNSTILKIYQQLKNKQKLYSQNNNTNETKQIFDEYKKYIIEKTKIYQLQQIHNTRVAKIQVCKINLQTFKIYIDLQLNTIRINLGISLNKWVNFNGLLQVLFLEDLINYLDKNFEKISDFSDLKNILILVGTKQQYIPKSISLIIDLDKKIQQIMKPYKKLNFFKKQNLPQLIPLITFYLWKDLQLSQIKNQQDLIKEYFLVFQKSLGRQQQILEMISIYLDDLQQISNSPNYPYRSFGFFQSFFIEIYLEFENLKNRSNIEQTQKQLLKQVLKTLKLQDIFRVLQRTKRYLEKASC